MTNLSSNFPPMRSSNKPRHILWLMPRIGTRTAQLMETPLLLAVIVFVSRCITARFDVPPRVASRIGMGCTALVLLFIAEFTLVLRLRGRATTSCSRFLRSCRFSSFDAESIKFFLS